MSTKIYEGFRLVSADLFEVHSQIAAFRAEIQARARAATLAYLAREMAKRVDAAALKGERAIGPLSDARRELLERQREIKVTGHRDPEVDFSFEISLMPFEGRVYGIPHCEQVEWVAALFGQPWVERFGYWNNTDRPKGVSAKAWALRGALWRRMLDQDPGGRPCGCGFTADLGAPAFLPDLEEVVALCGGRVERAKALGIDAVRARFVGEAVAGEPEPAPLHLYMGAIREAEIYLGTAEGRAEARREAAQIRARLPEITVEFIRGAVPGAPAATGKERA